MVPKMVVDLGGLQRGGWKETRARVISFFEKSCFRSCAGAILPFEATNLVREIPCERWFPVMTRPHCTHFRLLDAVDELQSVKQVDLAHFVVSTMQISFDEGVLYSAFQIMYSVETLFQRVAGLRGVMLDFGAYYRQMDAVRDASLVGTIARIVAGAPPDGLRACVGYSIIQCRPGALHVPFEGGLLDDWAGSEKERRMMEHMRQGAGFPASRTAIRLLFCRDELLQEMLSLTRGEVVFLRDVVYPMHEGDFPSVSPRSVKLVEPMVEYGGQGVCTTSYRAGCGVEVQKDITRVPDVTQMMVHLGEQVTQGGFIYHYGGTSTNTLEVPTID